MTPVTSAHPLSSLPWRLDEMPDQTGRTAVVTGATGGLGRHVALELARRGARVTLLARDSDKLGETRTWLEREVPGALLDGLIADLADQASVRRAAEAAERLGPLHLLVNNAGVMAAAHQRTVDGLELQLATNHFGPFLLTGLLLPQLVESGSGRVVTVSSNGHRMVRDLPLGDPRRPHTSSYYGRWQVYARTKLANLLFAHELERRLRARDLPVIATAAHPGYSGTHLLATGQVGGTGGLRASILDAVMKATAQPAQAGALPILMAAAADLPGGTYCGPGGPGQWRGAPRVVACSRAALDEQAAATLWRVSEEVTGLRYP